MISTLADFPDLMLSLYVHDERHHPFDATCRSTHVYAPCCGRRTAADSIIDVRGVKGTVVRGGGHRPAEDHDWLCDGCRLRMIHDRSNDWTLSKLMESCGASTEEVLHHRTREHADKLARDDHDAGRPHEPEKAWLTAHAHVRSAAK